MTPPSGHAQAQEADIGVGPLKLHLKGANVKSLPMWIAIAAFALASYLSWRVNHIDSQLDKMSGTLETVVSLLKAE